MAKIVVHSESYKEEFVWALAWMLASFDGVDCLADFSEALDNYDPHGNPEDYGFAFITEDDDPNETEHTRRRTLAFVYEWMLMGHETSRICFQRFMEARLS